MNKKRFMLYDTARDVISQDEWMTIEDAKTRNVFLRSEGSDLRWIPTIGAHESFIGGRA